MDTEEADQILQANDASHGDASFWEDKFESYYELRVRFEREDRGPGQDSSPGQ